MGSSFFKGKQPSITGGNQNLMARAIGAGGYAARSAGIGAQKSLAMAKGENDSAVKAHGPLKRTAAYPKGPKV